MINARNWNALNEFDKIGAIYDHVQNNTLLGYNKYDDLSATQVLADGIGQCNTKATLLMALLRAVGLSCRLHGTRVTKVFQRSLMPKIMAKLAPPLIVHTWAEVYYNGEWLSLEGVITDKAYISGLQKLNPEHKGKFFDYAVTVQDFNNLQIDWSGKNTTVQQQAVVKIWAYATRPMNFIPNTNKHIAGSKSLCMKISAEK